MHTGFFKAAQCGRVAPTGVASAIKGEEAAPPRSHGERPSDGDTRTGTRFGLGGAVCRTMSESSVPTSSPGISI